MADYKAMYYHLAGRMATTIEVLGTTTDMLQSTAAALADLKSKLELAQQTTEEMFISADNEAACSEE